MTTDTTSAGMPPIAAAHDALDMPPLQAVPAAPASLAHGGSGPTKPAQAVQSLVGEAKSQVSSTLNGVADAVRDVAGKLEDGGAAPLAKYVHDAADRVAAWGGTIDDKSVDELLEDTRTLVRTNPALAVALAVAGGFVVSRIVRAR
ncbi:MAG: hypothetical protein JO290_07805 [Sphingomonadaceae bacterium]|nr:hypothetical protein [Sphingomonadaceae bacterium]